MRTIDKIILHCAATREGHDYTVSDITEWHKERGVATIGYHYVIYRDGSVHKGRPDEQMGAHVTGHNATSIGICYIGGLDAKGNPKDTRTPEQKASLTELVNELKVRYPKAKVYGHYEFAAKACPCFDVKQEFR